MRDIVEEGSNGFLFAQRLGALLADAPMLERMRQASYEKAGDSDLDKTVAAYESVLRESSCRIRKGGPRRTLSSGADPNYEMPLKTVLLLCLPHGGLFPGLSEGAKKTSWFVAFGVIGPVTGDLSFRRLRAAAGCFSPWGRFALATPWRDLFQILVAVGVPSCLLVGLFLPSRIGMLYSCYAVAVMATNRFQSFSCSWAKCSYSSFRTVSLPVRRGFSRGLALPPNCVRLVLSASSGAGDLGSLAGSLKLATATFLFWGFSRHIGDAGHAIFPGIILMLVGCFWSWRPRPLEKHAWQLVCKDPILGRTVRHFFLAFGILLFFLSATFAFDAGKRGFLLAINSTPGRFRKKPYSINWQTI